MAEAAPKLLFITDVARVGLETTLARLELLLSRAAPGQVVVQLRDRDFTAQQRLTFGWRLKQLTLQHRQLLIVNDRMDLALCLGAYGVHLGEQSVSPADARALLGPTAWISAACHQPEAVASERFEAADAVVLSPVFAARKGNAPLGARALEQTREQLRQQHPACALYALGGVGVTEALTCQTLGIGAAAMGAIYAPEDPTPLLAALGMIRRTNGERGLV
jgi:thiamine-phosphate pyrophosphorylase